MTKLVVLLVACVLLSLGAGVFIGALWHHRGPPPDPFVSELNLTAEQQEKLKAIWSEAMQKGGFHVQDEQRAAAQKDYHQALRALVPAEQQARCDEALRNYQKRLEDIERDSRKIFDDATEQSRQVLSEEQRAKYDEIRRRHSERMKEKGPGGKPGMFLMPPPPGSRPPRPPPNE
jgi:Spy/CpxP family protein refolding chaperone